jgi:hypothetical protein
VLSAAEEDCFRKAHLLLGYHACKNGRQGYVSRQDLQNAMHAMIDFKLSDLQLNDIMKRYSSDGNHLNFEEFKSLFSSVDVRPIHNGRNWVAISLKEAETIRKILHIRKFAQSCHQVQGECMICHKRCTNCAQSNSGLELSLRYSPSSESTSGDGGLVFDATPLWRRNSSNATLFEASVAHNSFRFFNCDLHFPTKRLNVLIKCIKGR